MVCMSDNTLTSLSVIHIMLHAIMRNVMSGIARMAVYYLLITSYLLPKCIAR